MEKLINYQKAGLGNLRALMIKDEPWFVLQDVANLLGGGHIKDMYQQTLDQDEKMMLETPGAHPGLITRTALVNESGLYTILLRCNRPSAKPFRRWVTHEVLPAVRKTGVYAAGEEFLDEDANNVLNEMKQMLVDFIQYNADRSSLSGTLDSAERYTSELGGKLIRMQLVMEDPRNFYDDYDPEESFDDFEEESWARYDPWK